MAAGSIFIEGRWIGDSGRGAAEDGRPTPNPDSIRVFVDQGLAASAGRGDGGRTLTWAMSSKGSGSPSCLTETLAGGDLGLVGGDLDLEPHDHRPCRGRGS